MLVRQLVIGEGRPKICVPVVGKNEQEIMEQMRKAKESKADLVEWRVDYYPDFRQKERVGELLCNIRQVLEDKPLLFTFRTKEEGGERQIEQEAYEQLNVFAAKSGYVDLIDVELEKMDGGIAKIRQQVQDTKVFIVASNHDFEKTPSTQEMVERLKEMQHQGADIAKIAVMPHSRQDVLNLLTASVQMQLGSTPIVTMAMGKLGMISRIAGDFSGSAITFGAMEMASAPGQMDCERLYQILNWL